MRRMVALLICLTVFSVRANAQSQADRVVLDRADCPWGGCPDYNLVIERSGRVTFTGRADVMKKTGTRQLPQSAFNSLVTYFHRSRFFELDSSYLPGQPGCPYSVTEGRWATLTVIESNRRKSVKFYYHCVADDRLRHPETMKSFPPPTPIVAFLDTLSIHVDSVAGTDEWAKVYGNWRLKPVHHHVFIGREREILKSNPAFLSNRNFEGVQITYPWVQLEHAKDEYDFSTIREDREFLKSKNKKLWIQLSDVSFNPNRTNLPKYLSTDTAYHGGAAMQYSIPGDDDSRATPAGYVARRWDAAVQDRFQKLIFALGKEFDGKVEGINLTETSITFGSSGKLFPAGFVQKDYPQAIAINLKALKLAFPKSIAMQYANFMPGEWRPLQDKYYLARVYTAAENTFVGVGGPDLMPFNPGQLKSSYPLIREAAGRVPTGIAVQDGNLEQINPKTGKRVTASELLDFAMNYLRVDYIFWGTEEPYFSKDVVPTINRLRP